MKKVTIELTGEEYENFQSVADHFTEIGIPMHPDTVVKFALKSIKGRSSKQLISETNKALRSLTAIPSKKQKTAEESE